MSPEEKSEKQEFKINDRRRFQADGTPLEAPEEVPEAAAAPETPDLSREKPAPQGHQEIPADFASLLLSLAAGAQAALGVAPHPVTGHLEKDLIQAKYSIDLLGILQEKTRGNLNPEEEKLLEALLYDLRLRYVEAK